MQAEFENTPGAVERDEIVTEVRAAREAYAAQFGYDVRRILEDLTRKAAAHPERRSQVPPITPVPSRS